jgi:hypothetical protein
LTAGSIIENQNSVSNSCSLTSMPVTWTKQPAATKKDNKIIIDWAVASQINCAKFIVQHSVDLERFDDIGSIPGEGNYLSELAYNHSHIDPVLGINYYRIKQEDFDGNYTYSAIADVEYKSNTDKIYPNPSKDFINIYTTKGSQIEIFDMFGKAVNRLITVLETSKLDISEYKPGIYFFKLSNGNNFKVVIYH